MEKGCKSVYGIARKLHETVLALLSQTRVDNFFAETLLKMMENDDFEMVAIDRE